MFLVPVLILAALLLADGFGLRSGLLTWLSGEESEGSANADGSSGIPVMDREEEIDAYVFFDITNENALDNIIPAPCYTRVMTVTYGWGDRETERSWTLEADGDCWRLYDLPDEIFCVGSRIYSYSAGCANVCGGTGWEPEIGASTLDDIRACMHNPDYASDISATERTVQVRTVCVNHLKDFYEIDVDSGLILTEICRFDTGTVRSITTDSLTLRENPVPREQYEERARAFLEAHPEVVP